MKISPKKLFKRILAWSFSRYATYERCPFQLKRQVIEKAPFIENDAMRRGKAIHLLGENWMKGKVKKLPIEYEFFKDQMHQLKSLKGVAEEQWTFNKKLWPTGWFDYDAWLRAKIDVHAIDGVWAWIVDHKTGRLKDDYLEQLELYAFIAFLMYEDLERVTAEIFYLDAKVVVTQNFTIKDFPGLKKLWLNRIKPMMNDTKFLPNPNYLCKWCQFRKNGGDGTCKF